jgi:methyl-accepting chemotaxis protein
MYENEETPFLKKEEKVVPMKTDVVLRKIGIRARLRIAFGAMVAIVMLLCLIGFSSTTSTQTKAGEVLRAVSALPQDQGIGQKLQDIVDGGRGMRLCFLAFCVASLALGITASSLIMNSIESPINRISFLMSRLAEGDLSIDPGAASNDEFQRVKDSLVRLLKEWRTVVMDMKSAAGDISAAAQELSASADQMSGGSDDQARRSSQVATASEEMSQTILDIAKNANGITQSASSTVTVANDGDQIVTKSLEKVTDIAHIVDDSATFVKSLGERSKQIGGIVNVINDIADQTNLLALNAAIEAARAGEQGRGFAVVADEVKKLAERTATSTSEIGQMIGAIQDEVSKAVQSMENATSNVGLGVDLVTQAGSVLQAIVRSANDLQLMVQQIASATDEMSATSGEISKDMEQMASVSKETYESADVVARISARLAGLSGRMDKTANTWKLDRYNG